MPKPDEVTAIPRRSLLNMMATLFTKTSGELVSSGQAVAAGKGKGSGGKMFTQSQMQDLAIQAGFSPENAKIMAAIGMGESGGDSTNDTVQSGLDPGKK